ncbi:MAG: enoyl-CoA hydratase/isomerase family protein [Actinomycetota bacterium]|nr:enoyl-CoA hydratase/isomerase family protein [Actinomycetota bacterium]
MSYETLIVDVADSVATVTMNRPSKRNAVNRAMFEELKQAFEWIAKTKDVRAYVLTGAGDHFCSGADLSTLDEAPKTPSEMLARMGEIHEVMRTIMYCPTPGIAAVRGYAAGGGANLALACDLVVMTSDAKFAELFVKRGLVVDMSGTFSLPRTVGLHRAKELALLGDTIDAQRAYEIGIANRVVAPEELETTVKDLASRLASGPPITLALMKKALNDSFAQTFDEVVNQESYNQSILFSTADLQEAIRAFFEKRQPNFTGD